MYQWRARFGARSIGLTEKVESIRTLGEPSPENVSLIIMLRVTEMF